MSFSDCISRLICHGNEEKKMKKGGMLCPVHKHLCLIYEHFLMSFLTIVYIIHIFIKFKFKIVLSLNTTVCDNYTNYTNKHVTKRTQNRYFQVNMLGVPCPQF